MCGLAGILKFNSDFTNPDELHKMGNALAHRGPDSQGIWYDKQIGFAHQRLSIIDTSNAGAQPMHHPNGRYSIVFNGEIYNHNEFRDELKSKGYSFFGGSDTEVVLYLYEVYGAQMLDKLNGMFAICIWDHQKEELFIARDRFGVKPLYYTQTPHAFYFASEPKAIFAAGVSKEINEQDLNEWLMFRYIAGEKTMLKNVLRLLPGHHLTISRHQKIDIQRWYNLGQRTASHHTIENPLTWFTNTFHDSVKYRMVSDVPVGVLLSGGLDSSSVAASINYSGFKNIHTFNIGFRNQTHDESSIAKKFSEELAFPFHSIILEGKALTDSLLKANYHLDEPLVHLNDPQLLAISAEAKQHVKVLLSGEGADEMLGGYVRYKTFRYLRYRSTIKSILAVMPTKYKTSRISKLERYINVGGQSQLIMTNASNYFESDFDELNLRFLGIGNNYRAQVMDEARKFYPNNPTKQLLYYDQHTYLQSLNERNDRATMAASIECREPFQDYRLMEGVSTLDLKWLTTGKKGKRILKDAMTPLLPRYILNHKKVGLSVPWIEQIKQAPDLLELWNDFKENPETNSDLLNQVPLKKIINEVEQHSNHFMQSLVLQYFMFYLWRKVYL